MVTKAKAGRFWEFEIPSQGNSYFCFVEEIQTDIEKGLWAKIRENAKKNTRWVISA